MNRKFASCLMAGAALVLTGTALVAHHAESAQFDVTKPVEVTGVSRKSSGRTRTSGSTSM